MANGFKPLPKNKKQIIGLILSLKEGEGIWFSRDNVTGHQGTPEWIEKRVEGDYYVYLSGVGKYKEYLENDEEIEKFAEEISENLYLNYYIIQSIQGYTKHQPRYS